jgi:hypothetical protein
MVKDVQAYEQTNGWAWGRWRGMDLKPYGTDAHFVNKCKGGHMPFRHDDDVYTLPITRATCKRARSFDNRASALLKDLLP